MFSVCRAIFVDEKAAMPDLERNGDTVWWV